MTSFELSCVFSLRLTVVLPHHSVTHIRFRAGMKAQGISRDTLPWTSMFAQVSFETQAPFIFVLFFSECSSSATSPPSLLTSFLRRVLTGLYSLFQLSRSSLVGQVSRFEALTLKQSPLTLNSSTLLLDFSIALSAFRDGFDPNAFFSNYLPVAWFVSGYFIAKFIWKTKVIPVGEIDFVSGLKEIEAEAAIWDAEDELNKPTTFLGKLFVNFK